MVAIEVPSVMLTVDTSGVSCPVDGAGLTRVICTWLPEIVVETAPFEEKAL
jgi:hypothetical protein